MALRNPVVPHASDFCSYHVISRSNCLFHEYLPNSPDGKDVVAVLQHSFLNELIPKEEYLDVSVLNKPGYRSGLNGEARMLAGRPATLSPQS